MVNSNFHKLFLFFPLFFMGMNMSSSVLASTNSSISPVAAKFSHLDIDDAENHPPLIGSVMMSYFKEKSSEFSQPIQVVVSLRRPFGKTESLNERFLLNSSEIPTEITTDYLLEKTPFLRENSSHLLDSKDRRLELGVTVLINHDGHEEGINAFDVISG